MLKKKQGIRLLFLLKLFLSISDEVILKLSLCLKNLFYL